MSAPGDIGVTARLATHLAALQPQDLPAEVLAVTRAGLADTLAVALAGLSAAGVRSVHALVRADSGTPEAALWGRPERLPAAAAAFANSVAAAALDYDGLDPVAVTHNDIVTVPALLAVAQRTGASGQAFLTTLAATNDLVSRLSEAAEGQDGWFRTSVFGVIGAAAGSARLLGLPAPGIVDAMGVALSSVGGTQQPMVERALTKRLQAAFAARAGVQAALLVQAGIRAPQQALEGRFGLYAMYQRGQAQRTLDGLGRDWRNTRLLLKPYPSCAATHAAIEAARELVAQHRLAAGDVAGIEVVLTPFAHRLVGAPYAPDPASETAAQFSVQYALASVLARGGLSVADLQPQRAAEPGVVALARRIRVAADPALGEGLAPAIVRLATRDGTVLEQVGRHLPGSPGQPLSPEAHRRKLQDCLHAAGVDDDVDAFLDRIAALAQLPDLRAFALPQVARRPA